MSFVSSLLFAVSASLDALLVGVTYGIRKIRIPLLHNLFISLITLIGTILAICAGKALTPLLSRFPFLTQHISRSGSAILLGMGLYYLLKKLLSFVHKKTDTSGENTACCEPDAAVAVSTGASDNAPISAVSTSSSGNAPISATSTGSSDDAFIFAASTDPPREVPSRGAAPLTLRELALMGVALSLNNMGIGIGASMTGIPLLSASILTFLFSVCFLFLGNSLGNTKSLGIADQYTDLISGLLLILLGISQIFT